MKPARMPVSVKLSDLSQYDGVFTASKEVHRRVWKLAWPAVTTMLLQTANMLLDTFFVGHTPQGVSALAAAGAGGQVNFLLVSIAMGISTGATALVARASGAGERREAERAASQSITLSILAGAVLGAIVFMVRSPVSHWLLGGSADARAAHLCSQYLGVALLASAPNFLINALVGIFRGIGDTHTPMRIQAVMILAHISMDWLLIFGHCHFPRMGIVGAAAALALSISLGTALYVIALATLTPLNAALKWKNLTPIPSMYWRILRIGIPASIKMVFRTLSMMAFTGMLALAGQAAGVAALVVGSRAEAVAYMPGFGFSIAAAAMVGQSLGANKPDLADRYARAACLQGMLIMSVMGTLFFLFAHPFAALFSSDHEVTRMAADYLRINAFTEPFMAMGMILTGALDGAGDTLRPTAITLFTLCIIRLPLAWFLIFPLHLLAYGAWLAMAVSTILSGVLTWRVFHQGKWKLARV